MSTLPLMTQAECDHCEIIADESGFGAMQTDAGNLPLKALEVDARIVGLVATTTVRQTYVNTHERPLEATYIFPLPHRGAVTDFKMVVDDRVIDGVLKERGEARREYRQAIEQGHRASIVEEDRPDVFNMRVGNIAPGEEATIELTILVPLIYVQGEATFRFPLVVAPRYIPGSPLDGPSVGAGVAPDTDAVPDASRISPPVLLPGFPNPVALSIKASIDKRKFEIGDVKSSLHAVKSTENSDRIDIVIEPGERLNRDFILRFGVAQDQISTNLVTVPDDEGKEGTFVLTVIPPKPADDRRHRDVVFVLDRSGSMSGWKMVAARRAVGRMIDSLGSEDRFQVLAFDDRIEMCPLGGELLEASNRNRYRTIEWISKIDARGGTEIADPLLDAINMVNGKYQDRDRFVVLITDGQVGNERQILQHVGQALKGNTRIFTVGIDEGVNAAFLEGLADAGSGRCELVESEDRLDDVMHRLHETIDTPVVTELSLSMDGATLINSTITPRRATALFGDSPLVLAGRYSGSAENTIRLSGAFSDGSLFSTDVESAKTDDHRIAAVWARAQIRSLEDEFDVAQYNQDKRQSLETKIVATSLKFGVLCRFTSYVAVDREHKIDQKDPLHEVVQPVEAPEGWDMLAQRSMAAPMAPPPGAPAPMAMAPRMSAPSPKQAKKKGIVSQAFSAVDKFAFGSGGAADFDDEIMEEAPMEMEMSADFASDEWDDIGDTGQNSVDVNAVLSTSLQVEKLEERKEQAVGRVSVPTPVGRRRDQALSKTMTRAGVAKGNFHHMSPEGIAGKPLTPAHDVFVLALILIELLLGKKLWKAKSDVGLMSEILDWDASKLDALQDELGDLFEPLKAALAASPEDRPQSAAEFVDSLGIDATDVDFTTLVAATPNTGEAFGPFQKHGHLMSGSQFEIWSASLNGEPAVVRIAYPVTSTDASFTDVFFAESSVEAPYVLKLAGTGEDDSCAWVAFQGEAVASLHHLRGTARSDQGLPKTYALEAIRQVAQALDLVHRSGEYYGLDPVDEFVVLADGTLAAVGLGDLPQVPATSAPQEKGLLDRLAFWK